MPASRQRLCEFCLKTAIFVPRMNRKRKQMVVLYSSALAYKVSLFVKPEALPCYPKLKRKTASSA
jgi:hypothetical protein